jgi:ketosteroid isomerase-like protein
MPAPRSRRFLSRAIVFSSLLTALLNTAAIADEAADVSRLMQAGQHADALVKADRFLVHAPNDAQMRFLKGVILTEQNKPAEAIRIFTRLTEDFPDLPAPHNNLAVLYAAGGQYEKARTALDKALRTSPAYATAYENLGDVHAKLASMAYDKALQLDSRNSGEPPKLALVRNLGAAAATMPGTTVAAKPVPARPPVPDTKIAAAPVIPPAPGPVRPAAPAAALPIPAPLAAPKADIAKAPPKPEPAPAAKPLPDDRLERDAVESAIGAWAKAWSAKDIKAYLGSYANEFTPPNGLSRKAWAEERSARIADKGRISVRIETPQVKVDGNAATVKFRQIYASDRLSTNSRKTLMLVRQQGKWLIKQERAGS